MEEEKEKGYRDEKKAFDGSIGERSSNSEDQEDEVASENDNEAKDP